MPSRELTGSSNGAHVNCTAWSFLEPDSDVTGIGVSTYSLSNRSSYPSSHSYPPLTKDGLLTFSRQVVLSFLFSAYLTLLFAIFQFMLPASKSPVPLDRALREILVPRRLEINRGQRCVKLTKAVESTILTISDMQLITSVTILVSGYLQLPKGISLYHWTTIVYLAWFSALTHLATLTSLRHFFRSRPVMATGRVILMGLVLVLLSVAFVPTGFNSQRSQATWDGTDVDHARSDYYRHLLSAPTLCFYSSQFTKDALASLGTATQVPGDKWYTESIVFSSPFNVGLVGISVVFLVTSYVTRVIRTYVPPSRTVEHWLRILPMDFLQKRYRIAKAKRPLSRSRMPNNVYKAILIISITLAEAFYEIGDSMLWEILWLSSAVAWGTLRLIGLRMDTALVGKASWGFGQVLALGLCVLPIWDFVNSLFQQNHSCATSNATAGTASTGQNNEILWTLEEIKRTTWFRSLTALIMGMATLVAAATLFHLPAAAVSPDSPGLGTLASGKSVALTLLVYVMGLASCLVTLVVFVSICLAVHFRQKNCEPPRYSPGSQPWMAKIRSNRRLRTSAWCILILLLLVFQAGFLIVMFTTPGFVLHLSLFQVQVIT